jgi:hypothetical protein
MADQLRICQELQIGRPGLHPLALARVAFHQNRHGSGGPGFDAEKQW